MKYMQQLDSLRAFAVFAVMYSHFFTLKPLLSIFTNHINWGLIGVELFFVLSGFLITNILLQSKVEIENNTKSILQCMKKFYTRRILRIFPIYYLTLLVTAIIGIDPVRETILWHVTYLSNFYINYIGNWPGSVSHLWSLAVEEQYYVIWPFIIFLVPRRHLLITILIVISISPLYRLSYLFLNPGAKHNSITSIVLIWGCLDLLGIGGLLALLKSDVKYLIIKKYVCRFGIYICCPLFLCLLILFCMGINTKLFIIYRTVEAFFFVWLIDRASEGFNGICGTIMNFKPLISIGKVSYGVYLFHNFMPPIIKSVSPELTQAYIGILSIITTLVLAYMSWYLVEKPISRYKNRGQII